jgi:predicted nucleic acid-binding protein
MIIETDILYAHVKTGDWLKPIAEKMLHEIASGKHGSVLVSREVLHELYYVSKAEGVSLDEYIKRAAALTNIPNLVFHPSTVEIDLLALTLMRQYGLTSIFDAYHAATCLNADPDHHIYSTDQVYDKIPGITRTDPREHTRVYS